MFVFASVLLEWPVYRVFGTCNPAGSILVLFELDRVSSTFCDLPILQRGENAILLGEATSLNPSTMHFFFLPAVLGILTVKLIKVTNLRDVDGIGKSDPYVKLQLKQDNWVLDRNYGRQESSKKSNDLSPEYGETFKFKDVPSLKNMVLKVRIMDDDFGFDDEIGSCNIRFNWFGLSEEPRTKTVVVDRKRGYSCLPSFLAWIPGSGIYSLLFRRKAKVYLELSYKE